MYRSFAKQFLLTVIVITLLFALVIAMVKFPALMPLAVMAAALIGLMLL